ncbi:hypothetical protein Tco_0378485 [Tanacetum coccineum]
MKFAFFFFAFILLLETYHARHLHDVFVNRKFNRPAPLRAAEIIQMVTHGEELLSPPLLEDKMTYGRVNSPPPPPQGGSTRGQTTYGRINPKAPPSPSVAPSRGQTTYGVENPTFTAQTTQTSPNPSELDIHNMYGRVDPRTPPSPEINGSRGHGIYDREDLSVPTTPQTTDSIRPVLSERAEYARIDVRSKSTELSISPAVNLIASYSPIYYPAQQLSPMRPTGPPPGFGFGYLPAPQLGPVHYISPVPTQQPDPVHYTSSPGYQIVQPTQTVCPAQSITYQLVSSTQQAHSGSTDAPLGSMGPTVTPGQETTTLPHAFTARTLHDPAPAA